VFFGGHTELVVKRVMPDPLMVVLEVRKERNKEGRQEIRTERNKAEGGERKEGRKEGR
jgi:hypothetical protein